MDTIDSLAVSITDQDDHLLNLRNEIIMSEGVVLVALANSLLITIKNNSNEIVHIEKPELLCLVCYKKFYNEIQMFLEKEVATREALSKKYFRAAKIVDNVDTVLITITLGAGTGGIALLSTVVTSPVVIPLEGMALFTGLLSIIGKYSVKKTTSKAEKHQKNKKIASTKLDTISSHISKALRDNKVPDEEFRLILKELEKYKVMKEEVRAKTKKKIATELEETLIERGRQEARESFQKLVEKDNTGS